MVGRVFRAHGEFCASHPWEVIVATFTLTACMLTMDRAPQVPVHKACGGWRGSCLGLEAEYNAADVIVMTVIRCSAVLYIYYQFCNLHKLGSKYILGIAGLFTVFSSFVFTSSVINFLRSDISDLKDALFFFLLLIDLSKAALLAQIALNSSNQAEVKHNIARGMELLGPTITLDTVVETLVIGVGTLSGVHRLEVLCCFACMSVLVNYIVFMTFYPACLSLILELSRSGASGRMRGEAILIRALHDDDQKVNPVVQRVKIIMSAGLMLVHAHSRLALRPLESEASPVSPLVTGDHTMTLNRTEDITLPGYFMKWVSVSAEQIVIFILLFALAVKFVFCEVKEELTGRLLKSDKSTEIEEDKLKLSGNSMDLNQTKLINDDSLKNGIKEDRLRKRPIFSIENDVVVEDKCTQTEVDVVTEELDNLQIDGAESVPRSLQECVEVFKSEIGAQALTDAEVALLVQERYIALYKIESIVDNPERGVKLRRNIIGSAGGFVKALENLPYRNYDYTKVMNACCENVIGYVQVPVGFAGPLLLDGVQYYVPMATTEGALVASTNRGCKALMTCGVRSVVEDVGMTRAPCVKFPSVMRAHKAKLWLESIENFDKLKTAFDSTSRFARLQEIHIGMDGPQLYIRFRATTGDAMGMNMVSKGSEMALRCVQKTFPDMEIISLSGNYCSDKKPAAINWIKGRGKRVVCEAIVPHEVLGTVFKTTAKTLVQCNKLKNMAGAAMAGSIGGNNAHAANMVTAIYIATGQDPAQNITSSNCSTGMDVCGENGEDLYMTCTMPSLEVGTVGGGTVLPGQGACLDMLGLRGPHPTCPAQHSKQLARVVCATVLAGELSLMAALVNSDLVRSHMRHNRSSVAVNPGIAPLPSFMNSLPSANVTGTLELPATDFRNNPNIRDAS